GQDQYIRLLQLWARVQHEMLYVFWSIMEVTLLAPVAMSLMAWARYWPPGQVLFWMLLLMLFAFNLTRLLSVLQIDPDRQRTITALALLLTIFFAIRGLAHEPTSLLDFRWLGQFVADVGEQGNRRWAQDLSLFIVIVVLWYRGIRLVNREFDINQIGLRLRVGGLLLAPIIVWLSYRRLLWDITPVLLLFFLAGLTAVSLIRAEQLEQDRSKQSASLDPRWLLLIFIAGLLTILTAGLFTTLVTGQTADTIVGWLSPVIIGIQFLLSVALGTLLFLAIPLLELLDIVILFLSGLLSSFWIWLTQTYTIIEKIISKLVNTEPVITENAPGVSGLNPEEIAPRILHVGDMGEVANILTILLMIAVVLLVALVVSGMYRRNRFADKSSRLPATRLDADSRQDETLLNRILQRLGFLRGLQTAVTIRRIYKNMLQAADAGGYPRLDSETPYEYLVTLAQAWPDHRIETEKITRAYVNIRYGELPETQAELNAIRTAWQQLEKTPIQS
ncbi:MAG: DUF4129 domain-containing protein, partial [Anaerolineales bacterium]|nr:DUF4129 domain-containing protein [Anaerolineales bacterium]